MQYYIDQNKKATGKSTTSIYKVGIRETGFLGSSTLTCLEPTFQIKFTRHSLRRGIRSLEFILILSDDDRV
jgi:hypothetical protein